MPAPVQPENNLIRNVAAGISNACGDHFSVERISPLAGGSICESFLLAGCGQRYFLKTGKLPFSAEVDGLIEIAATNTLSIPHPVCSGENENTHWLVLEYVPMSRRGNFALMGAQLAQMHRCHSERFGWKRSNFIGLTPQGNEFNSSWVDFWRKNRLGFQLDLACKNGHSVWLRDQGERLLTALDAFFADYRPLPSLLHGDLWSDNAAFNDTGEPLVYDPAVYYGDREADMAMSELFGGFGTDFYSAYRESYPLDPGYEVRKDLYNLYHILNHLNLFRGGYREQAQRMIGRLLSEIR